jgi:hypothetical protein
VCACVWFCVICWFIVVVLFVLVVSLVGWCTVCGGGCIYGVCGLVVVWGVV